MKRILLTFIAIISFSALFAQQQYSKVKIYLDGVTIPQLIQMGIGIDHGDYKKGEYFISDFSSYDIDLLEQNNVSYDVLIEDVTQYYVERSHNSEVRESRDNDCSGTSAEDEFVTPDGFELGSMGGFFTYQEFLDHVDTMFARYPNLITQRDTIGTYQTTNGKPIYWIKISDNPNVDETEPEVLYTAVHHAREPASLSQVIMYMYYLLENYGVIDEVTNIVDNTELYFIPMINPDGYIYNQQNNPNGGGMWRKNRRNNGGGEFGVDLNRNYGHAWGLDDNGSSPNPNSDTYRGPSAFSEPELQAVKEFSESHQFLMALNYHTYGNLLIYPWGYAQSLYTPDSAVFVEYAKVMTEQNSYTYGTGDQTVGYVTNGDSDDWQYGEQTTKDKTLSFTPEAGDNDDGFWPSINRIEPISKSNLRQNLNFAHLAGKYARVNDISSNSITSTSTYIDFEIKRLGLDSPATFTVNIVPVSNEITNVGSSVVFNNMYLLESRIDSISLDISSSVVSGQEIKFLLEVDNGNFVVSDTITKTFGQGTSIFTDVADTILNWSPTGNWDVTTENYHSAPSSFTDSPGGNHGSNQSTHIQLNDTIDLTDAIEAKLNFWARWELETGYDYSQVLASTDYGSTWTPLCGNYTKIGNSSQDLGNPVYNGFQFEWVQEQSDLNSFLGQEVLIRFTLETDPFTNEDGFYFDDVDIQIISDGSSTIDEVIGSNIKVFPNPNNGSFFVKDLEAGEIILVQNALGQTMTTQIVKSERVEITGLESGVYFVSTNKSSITKKVVVR